MRSDSSRKAAGWCSSFVPADPSARRPATPDALLVAGLLGAWGLASAATLDPATRAAFILAAFATAAFAGALYRRDRLRAGHVLLIGLGLRALVLGLPPVLSDDAYRYVWDGLVQLRGLNPYALTPNAAAEVVQDPALLARLNSPEYYSVYPPVSQFVFRLSGAIYAAQGFGLAYAALKALFAAADVIVLVLLIRAVPARRALLWAAAPLVVFEGSGQVHTEALCALALVGAALAERRNPPALRGGRVLADGGSLLGALLALAGWIKLVPFLMLPVWALRRDLKVVGGAVAVGLVLMLPFADSFVVPHVRESLDLYVRLFEFNAGPYYVLKWAGGMLFGMDVSKQLGPILRLAFLALLPLVWWRATRAHWPLAKIGVWVYGLFLATTTTLHPWYLVPLLALLPLTGRPGWAWHALGTASLGTYWFYTDGRYTVFVVLGWGAWAVLLMAEHRAVLLKHLMQWRARGKVKSLHSAMPPLNGLRVLDVGAGEGYVADTLARAGAQVVVADVAASARVWHPALVAGGRFPFADGAFDAVILVFVLHHTRDAEAVLQEACRVGRRVVVLESVFESPLERAVLERLDRLANGLRGAWMRAQAEPLGFRRAEAWEAVLANMGRVVYSERLGRPPHRQFLSAIEPLLQPKKILAEVGELAPCVVPRVALDEAEGGGPVEGAL